MSLNRSGSFLDLTGLGIMFSFESGSAVFPAAVCVRVSPECSSLPFTLGCG